jgi:hypothetical protein
VFLRTQADQGVTDKTAGAALCRLADGVAGWRCEARSGPSAPTPPPVSQAEPPQQPAPADPYADAANKVLFERYFRIKAEILDDMRGLGFAVGCKVIPQVHHHGAGFKADAGLKFRLSDTSILAIQVGESTTALSVRRARHRSRAQADSRRAPSAMPRSPR